MLGITGHYERVNADTHVAYETTPAYFVSAYRIAYEYAFSMHRSTPAPRPDGEEEEDAENAEEEDAKNAEENAENAEEEDENAEGAAPGDGVVPPPEFQREWDLPDELQPDGDFVPNRNLLGWYEAKQMSREMMDEVSHVVDLKTTRQQGSSTIDLWDPFPFSTTLFA